MKQRSNRRSTRRMRSRRRSVKRTNRTARRMRSRRRSSRRMRSRRSTRRSRRSRRTRRSRRRLLKGGSTEPLLAASPQKQGPNETLSAIYPQRQVFDTFKSSGELLTRNAMVEGNIKPVEMGKKVYQALSYSAYLFQNGDEELSGKYLLLAIHYIHKMRTGATSFARVLLKVCLAIALGVYYVGSKMAVKLLKKYLIPVDFAKRHAKVYFTDLKQRKKALHAQLYKNGEKIFTNSADAMETMLNDVRNSHTSSLGTGAVLRTGSGFGKI